MTAPAPHAAARKFKKIKDYKAMAAHQYVYVMKGLSKTFTGGKQVLKDIWLSFLPGAKIGIVGVNGAGKSTLLRIMAGIDTEFVGEAWAAEACGWAICGRNPSSTPRSTCSAM